MAAKRKQTYNKLHKLHNSKTHIVVEIILIVKTIITVKTLIKIKTQPVADALVVN